MRADVVQQTGRSRRVIASWNDFGARMHQACRVRFVHWAMAPATAPVGPGSGPTGRRPAPTHSCGRTARNGGTPRTTSGESIRPGRAESAEATTLHKTPRVCPRDEPATPKMKTAREPRLYRDVLMPTAR